MAARPGAYHSGEPATPVSLAVNEGEHRSWTRRWKRDSEWVFRPLRLKFKVKELELLYKNYVYRQQQSLLFKACMLLVFLTALVLVVFLARGKVRSGRDLGGYSCFDLVLQPRPFVYASGRPSSLRLLESLSLRLLSPRLFVKPG